MHEGPFHQPLPTKEMFDRAEELANMCIEEKDVKNLVIVDNLQMVSLLPSNQNITVESTTEEANATDQSNAGTEVVTDQFSPRSSPHSRRPGDLIIREPQPEDQCRPAIPTQPGKGKAIQLERDLSSSSDDEDDFLDQILNSDSEIFTHFNAPHAPKMKSGEGSGSTPPSKVPRTTPPNKGRQPNESTAISQLTPSSLPPSTSLTPTRLTGSSEVLRTAGDLGKELLHETIHDTSMIQSFESFPRLSIEVVLRRGLAQLMNLLVTISHAQLRAVDYKELIKVLNDKLVDAQARVETLTASEKDLTSKLEQAERTMVKWDESLRRLSDENQKQIQTNKSLIDQLEKLTSENEKLTRKNEELRREKEADLARYEEICFNCFYQVWKLNKPLNLDFLTEEVKAEELAKCEAKVAEEAANPAGTTSVSPTLSFQLKEAVDAEEGVDQPTIADQ
ncbi:uncharacterized protein LOC133830622 [Humulus lupulus]|uniref:uncharacterized protein LOC133830622 n=1 Tax=Humulus lupulus TaxID=3486 RepID=UPI002B410C3A|nr:uncharacterized protein LOC133830622 [Humulus lupulus]